MTMTPPKGRARVLRHPLGAWWMLAAAALPFACRPAASHAAHEAETVPKGVPKAAPSPAFVEPSPPESASGDTTLPGAGHQSDRRTSRSERCTRDEDCAVTTLHSCCSVCGRGDHRADLAWRVDETETMCAAAKCPERPPGIACAPPRRLAHPRAVCRAASGECALIDGGAPSGGL